MLETDRSWIFLHITKLFSEIRKKEESNQYVRVKGFFGGGVRSVFLGFFWNGFSDYFGSEVQGVQREKKRGLSEAGHFNGIKRRDIDYSDSQIFSCG